MINKASEPRPITSSKSSKPDDFTANKEREQQEELRRLIAIQARGQSDRL